MELQGTPPWKHSQYFFRQRDLRHLQPFLCAMLDTTVDGMPPACAAEVKVKVEEEEVEEAIVIAISAPAVGRYLESNALGFLSRIIFTAASLIAALSGLFSQDKHRQEGLQVALAAKH